MDVKIALFCNWCKKPIEGKGWADGSDRYCNHRCWSAKLMPVFIACSFFLIPFAALIFLNPTLLVIMFFHGVNDPISLIGESLFAFLLVAGFIVAVFLTTVGMVYSSYVGFRERRIANHRAPDSHTMYYD